MKNLKKILAVLLAMAMMAAMLAGCGSSSNGSAANSQGGTASGDAATSEGGDTASGTSDGDTVKVGVLLPFSGSTAYYGEVQYNGIEFCVDYINENGGVLDGKQIELVRGDSASDPETGVSAFELLVDQGVSAVIGIAAGLLLGGIAFFLYKAGVFVLCVFLVFFLCVGLIPIQWLAIVLGLALGIAVGVLAMKFMREVLIFTTAISGGMNAANALLPVFGLQNAAAALIVGLALAVLGIVVQWKTTAKA